MNDTEHFIKMLREEWSSGSDRSCVIVVASIIDELLGQLVRARLAPNPSSTDTLFDGPNAHLASFSARIDLAYRIGIISSKLCRDLHVIRRLRNRFAHSIESCTFADTGCKDQVEELMRSLQLRNRSSEPLLLNEDNAKGHFGWVAVAIITYLHRDAVRNLSIVPLSPPDADWLYKGKFSFAGKT
ncbi:MAG: hypothetical protein AB7J13_00150 [Pyrinomonadaceae bacterium]